MSRARILTALLVVIPLGLATKLGEGWVERQLGGLFYVVFWTLVLWLARPGMRAWRGAAAVLIATSLLEFLQLWHPPFLEEVRSTFPGRTLLGTTFAWSDLPWYGAGFLLCLPLGRLLTPRAAARRASADAGRSPP